MGRNHHRDGVATRRRNSGESVLSVIVTSQTLLSLYIQDALHQGESPDYTRKNIVVYHLEQTLRWKQFSLLVNDNVKRLPVLLQPTTSLRAKKTNTNTKTVENAYNVQQKVLVLEEISVE